MDEVLNSFNIFCRFSGDGHPGHLSFSTAIQKLLSGLKNVLQKPQEAFQAFGIRFTVL
jgi:hypothetical protein